MENEPHLRFLSANQDLRNFLKRAQSLANNRGAIAEKDLKIISLCLTSRAPEVGDASRSETLDTGLQTEVAEYVKNLRALQCALEKARDAMARDPTPPPVRRVRPIRPIRNEPE